MQVASHRFELLELTAMFVEANRELTDAMKLKSPYGELVLIYARIQAIYEQIYLLKNKGLLTEQSHFK